MPESQGQENKSDMVVGDLTDEEYREYEFLVPGHPNLVYRINSPKTLYTRRGGTTHRVLDNYGVVHCCPAPGFVGCVLRWKPKPGSDPVKF